MSCSTTSLSACTIKKTLSPEDPYVFTETTPTAPPTLFNTSQKTRNRLVVKHLNLNPTTAIDKTSTTTKNSCFSKIKNNNGNKTQTQLSISLKGSPLNTSAVLGVLNTNNIKFGTQLSKSQLESNEFKQAHVLFTQNENATALPTLVAASTNACIVTNRNVQQQKAQSQPKVHQNYQQLHHEQLQSQTPPPLLLSHTPSLWQTPLLLDDPKATKLSTSATTTTTSTATNKTLTTGLLKDNLVSASSAPIKISFPPPTPTLAATALITPISIPAVTSETAIPTTTGSITPLHFIMSSAEPLPPSNFHNTTLAQHLQKVKCLKKSKKPNSPSITANTSIQNTELNSISSNSTKSPSKASSIKTSKNSTEHSTADLNEIPVNVIFRSPSTSNNVDSYSQKEETLDNVDNSNNNLSNNPKNINNIKRKSNDLSSEKDSSKRVFVAGSNPSQKPSSKLAQKRKIACGGQLLSAYVTQPKQRKLIKSMVKFNNKSTVTNELTKNTITDSIVREGNNTLCSKSHKIGAKRKTSGIVQKTQKRNFKANSHSKPDSVNDQSDYLMIDQLNVPLATKAVAVVKIPYKEIETDISLFAEESILPYCVQRHWFNINERPIRSAAIGREERIIEYKNLLRRQAMQLLCTRSLQQLPYHIARKRLLSVDALIRKYRDHNRMAGDVFTIKKCEVENCSDVVLEKATYCQRHITRNTKQCIFVQCSAKSLKDNQKLCDVPVLNIKKPYSAPLCYIHAHQQRTTYNAMKTSNVVNQSILNQQPAVVATRNPSYRKRKIVTPTCERNSLNPSNLSNANVIKADNLQKGSEISLQRKNSTTSLESIASNSHSSFAGSVQQGLVTESTTTTNMCKQQISNSDNFPINILSPPLLAPLSYHNRNVNSNNLDSTFTNSSHRDNLMFGSGTLDATAEQEINKLVAQFAMVAEATSAPINKNNTCNGSGNNNNTNIPSFNYLNTNSNSNLTSSGVGSSSSLPSTDELLTQDMLSICENSSAYASSSEDTGLGELSENELIGTSAVGFGFVGGRNGNGGCVTSFNDDDVNPDEIPLGDTRLLEENDLVNVFGTLPVNLNELFTTVVRQDEREEVERALEIADKHLKTLQETIGSDSDFLADFLNVNDDMLADPDDLCNKMEIVSSVLSPSPSGTLEASSLYLENTNNVLNVNQHGTKNVAIPGNCVNAGNSNNPGVMDIRELLQT